MESVRLIGIVPGKENLVHRLVENTGNSQDQYREGVAEHPAQQRFIECKTNPQFRRDHQQLHHWGDQVGDQDVIDAPAQIEPYKSIREPLLKKGTDQEEEEVDQDGEPHVDHLDCCKADGSLFEAQVGKGDGSHHVETEDQYHQ